MKQALWQQAIEGYFSDCDATRIRTELKNGGVYEWQRPYTLYGLCAALELSADELLGLKDGTGGKKGKVLIRNALLKIASFTLERALRGDFTWQVATAAIKELGLVSERTEEASDGRLTVVMDSYTEEAAQ